MVIKVSTLLKHNTDLILDSSPTLGGPLATNNFPIQNSGNPVTITGNSYPINAGTPGQVLTTNGVGTTSWNTFIPTSATNIVGGTANEILFQSAPGVTSFIPAPLVTNTFLKWNGSSFMWASVPSAGTVTSVGLTSSASSITVSGTPNPITSSGTFNVDLPLSGVTPAIYGSTSSVGSFIINSRGIISSASNTPISITPTAAGLGNVTNSLQVINAGSVPSIQESVGVPLGSAAFGAIYVDQASTNGNSIYYYNGSIWNPISQKLTLYSENVSAIYTVPTALSVNSIALGEGAQTANGAVNALAIGNQSLGRIQGGVVQANGRFSISGDAQTGRYLLRGITSSTFPGELFIDGNGPGASSVRIVLPDNSTWTFKVTITAHRTDIPGHGSFEAKGLIYRIAGPASTSIQSAVNYTLISNLNNGWSINIVADTINGSLKITVTGSSGNTIRWLALVETVEVTN